MAIGTVCPTYSVRGVAPPPRASTRSSARAGSAPAGGRAHARVAGDPRTSSAASVVVIAPGALLFVLLVVPFICSPFLFGRFFGARLCVVVSGGWHPPQLAADGVEQLHRFAPGEPTQLATSVRHILLLAPGRIGRRQDRAGPMRRQRDKRQRRRRRAAGALRPA